jgi:predicted helicase
MSQLLIHKYLNELHDLKKVSGTSNETVVREAFKTLLKEWGRSHDLVFVTEYEIITPAKERRLVDGALLHELRLPFGYWEAKDEKDDLDAEIEFKFRRGYPQDNIIFEDSRQAVLIQDRQEVIRCAADDPEKLEKLLKLFFAYERAEIAEFRQAVAQFKTDLPAVLEALRQMIQNGYDSDSAFKAGAQAFLQHAQETINPSVTDADVREMLIQHILTEDIFSKVFGEDDFHRQNNVAKKLYDLEDQFFTGGVKKKTLKGLEPYYAAIRAAAAQISSHQEKQSFLKIIYENFHKVYNPKAADRLGVIYTPNEIVRFMVESADWLCQHHFGKRLIDKNVEILDPASGTGTFITELLEHFRGQVAKLKYKYREELHANEVAILPYYVANLNIEATYAALTGEYEEFPNLCFVDTLDNVGGLRKYAGHVDNLFGSVSEENVARIRRQNQRKISVIIGNPPYNANQLNENENNKNRTYPDIDQRIKKTYIATSTAQKTKLYDMYARFFRWASDRVDEKGIIAFVTNRSFIDSRTFDGFRKIVGQEFNHIYVVDLGGDVRTDPRLSGTKNNVFGIQTGVAISFLIKRARTTGSRIYYTRRPQLETALDKLAFLGSAKFQTLKFEEITPDKNSNWINLTDNDFDTLIPVASKLTKNAKKPSQEKAIFKLFSMGIVTARDEWVTDFNHKNLDKKVKYFIDLYEKERSRWCDSKNNLQTKDFVDRTIKWTSELENHMRIGTKLRFNLNMVRQVIYRPFIKNYNYYSSVITHRIYQQNRIYPIVGKWDNISITFLCVSSSNPLVAMAVTQLYDYCLLKKGNGGTQSLPRWQYDDDGSKVDNITDWALRQFRKYYEKDKGKQKRIITKDAIFHYVYGVLHDPVYREKYALNLRREFPHLPFYGDFWQWAAWGEKLMDLHIGYETVEPWPLHRVEVPDAKSRQAGLSPKAMLKADKDASLIILDSETQLTGIPKAAWDYKLGNRSALEWILDQYKEKTPKDPTIRAKFNTYRFADYKEHVINILLRVTRVSVETQEIVEAMRAIQR